MACWVRCQTSTHFSPGHRSKLDPGQDCMQVSGEQASLPVYKHVIEENTLVICQMTEQASWRKAHPGAACTQGRRVRHKTVQDVCKTRCSALPGRQVRTSAAAPKWLRSALASRAACSLGMPWVSTYDSSPRRRASLYACAPPLPECICPGLRLYSFEGSANFIPGTAPGCAGAQPHAATRQCSAFSCACPACTLPSQLQASAATRLAASALSVAPRCMTHGVRAASRARRAAARMQGDSMCVATVGVYISSLLLCSEHSLRMGSAGRRDPGWAGWGRACKSSGSR